VRYAAHHLRVFVQKHESPASERQGLYYAKENAHAPSKLRIFPVTSGSVATEAAYKFDATGYYVPP
jgi:hypothetical protein